MSAHIPLATPRKFGQRHDAHTEAVMNYSFEKEMRAKARVWGICAALLTSAFGGLAVFFVVANYLTH